MSVHALHFPERSQLLRWAFAGFAIVLAHAAAVTALVLWYKRTPPVQPIIPAIMITFEPAAPQMPAHDDKPLAEQKVEEIKEPPPEPKVEESKIEEPKIEPQKIEQPPEKVAPPPPRPARIALPKPEPKPEPKRVEHKKPTDTRPPREARDPEATPVTRQARVASSNDYNSLVIGQLERAKRNLEGAETGMTSLVFSVNSNGNLLGAHITKSSGSQVVERAALETIRRASPFPHFLPGMTGSQASFSWSFQKR
jgi:periplasmic protein TonB